MLLFHLSNININDYALRRRQSLIFIFWFNVKIVWADGLLLKTKSRKYTSVRAYVYRVFNTDLKQQVYRLNTVLVVLKLQFFVEHTNTLCVRTYRLLCVLYRAVIKKLRFYTQNNNIPNDFLRAHHLGLYRVHHIIIYYAVTCVTYMHV